LAQDVLRVDPIHQVFDEVHLHGLTNHHEPEDLHGDVVSLVQLVCEVHLQMDDALQSELDALRALDFVQDVKDGMGVHFYLPSLLSPSLSLIMNFISTSILGK
jgi:hypothetical protein